MPVNRLRFFATAIVLLALCGTADAALVPERRRPQFQTEPGYAIFPYPYSLPGIGMGIGVVGGAMNINNTYTDVYGMVFGGDVQGVAAGVADVHVVPRTLILDLGGSDISTVTIRSYGQRGMGSDKHDFSLAELSDTNYQGARLTSTFLDRRFEIFGAYYGGSSVLKRIRDKDGNIIIEAQNPSKGRGQTTIIGTRLDLTDDYQDPRRGLRLDLSRSLSPPRDSGPDFFVTDYSATAYVPLGRRSTWAFNYLRSDAHVERQGETDPAVVEKQQGLNCGAIVDPVQRQFCTDEVNSTVANNTFGTASSLGGFSRLRSYSAGRFSGAHAVFYGTEVRWNLTDEATPFDIFIMKDVRTSWQVSAFYETGSVADKRSEVGDLMRSSYGMGIRMVTASGVVFRADLAAGQEGIQPNIFIGYPWEL